MTILTVWSKGRVSRTRRAWRRNEPSSEKPKTDAEELLAEQARRAAFDSQAERTRQAMQAKLDRDAEIVRELTSQRNTAALIAILAEAA